MQVMRSHQLIVAQAGAEQIAQILDGKATFQAIRSWGLRNSIPAPYWATLVDHRLATLEELAASAAGRLRDAEAA